MRAKSTIVVIGGGLAGLSCGAHRARGSGGARRSVTGGLGGQFVSIEKIEGVPGFPDGVAGYDLCPMTQEQADKAGVEFSMAGRDRSSPTATAGAWRARRAMSSRARPSSRPERSGRCWACPARSASKARV